MRKLIIFICVITFSSSFARAQEWGDYVQLSVGSGLEIIGGYGGFEGFFLQGEYGKTYKWLDLSLSITYQTDNWEYFDSWSWFSTGPGQTFPHDTELWYDASNDFILWYHNTSVSVNARVDIVKFFTEESRHSVKAGIGIGVAFEQSASSHRDFRQLGVAYSFNTSNKIKYLPNARISYDFSITPKIALGIFAHGGRWQSIVGVGVRYNFIKQ